MLANHRAVSFVGRDSECNDPTTKSDDAQQTPDSLNEEFRVVVLEKRTAGEKNCRGQNDY